MNEKLKKGIALGIIGVIGLGLGVGAGFMLDQPKDIVTEKIVENTIYQDVEVITEVEVEKIVEVIVEDTAMMEVLCDHLMFDDFSECLDEVKAEDDALKLAFLALEDESDIFDMLEDEGIVEDEDEVKVIKVYKDFEDVEVLESDFDDEEYEFKIKMKIEDEDADEKKYVYFTVEIEDGEVEITNVEE